MSMSMFQSIRRRCNGVLLLLWWYLLFERFLVNNAWIISQSHYHHRHHQQQGQQGRWICSCRNKLSITACRVAAADKTARIIVSGELTANNNNKNYYENDNCNNNNENITSFHDTTATTTIQSTHTQQQHHHTPNTKQHHQEEHDDAQDDDDDDEEEEENDPSALPLMARDLVWLEETTQRCLDSPPGDLTADDAGFITRLMVAWARRRSVAAALNVEALLKRIVEDMHHAQLQKQQDDDYNDNEDDHEQEDDCIHVTARMYTIAMEAWAKSGAGRNSNRHTDNTLDDNDDHDEDDCDNNEKDVIPTGIPGYERAQQIHDAMRQQYEATGDERLAPTLASYNTLCHAWARSGAADAPARTEKLLRTMMRDYVHGHLQTNPNAFTFSTVLDAYGQSLARFSWRRSAKIQKQGRHAVERCQALFHVMDECRVSRNVYTYAGLQTVWARSQLPEAPQECLELLEEMQRAYNNTGDEGLLPNVLNYNAVLDAASRTPSKVSAQLANDLLRRMELPVEEGGYAVEPDTQSYAFTILAASRCPDYNVGVPLAEANLEAMEARARLEQERRRRVSSAAPASVRMDVEVFNTVLASIASAARHLPDAPQRIVRILKRMEHYAASPTNASNNEATDGKSPDEKSESDGAFAANDDNFDNEDFDGKFCTKIRPNVRSYNALLNALSRANIGIPNKNHVRTQSSRNDAFVLPTTGRRAEDVLNRMFQLHEAGVPNVLPNSYSFIAVLTDFQRSAAADPEHSAARADALLRRMEQLYEEGVLEQSPDVYHYTILCCTWAYSSSINKPYAADRCLQILAHMMERHQAGYPKVQPNVRTYNAVLDCLARAQQGDRAEQILYHMLQMYKRGHEAAAPDQFSFNSVIRAFTRSNHTGWGRRAEAVLDRLLEYQEEENPSVRPDVRSFTNIIAFYGRSKDLDGPYRAEYLLNRMVCLFKDGRLSSPPPMFGFTAVMDSYSRACHPDAGRNADRLLRMMEKLRDEYNAPSLDPTTEVYNRVLQAWANCGDQDGGRMAQRHLDRMEHMAEKRQGRHSDKIRPDPTSYRHVLTAWAKSSRPDKALHARDLLQSVVGAQRSVQRKVSLGEPHYTAALNACAFTQGDVEAESQAFDLAVELFDELLSSERMRPSSMAYALFIQCARLRVPDNVKRPHIERAFECCKSDGLVSHFVLHQLKTSVPKDLFVSLTKEASLGKQDDRLNFKTPELPAHWTRRIKGKGQNP